MSLQDSFMTEVYSLQMSAGEFSTQEFMECNLMQRANKQTNIQQKRWPRTRLPYHCVDGGVDVVHAASYQRLKLCILRAYICPHTTLLITGTCLNGRRGCCQRKVRLEPKIASAATRGLHFFKGIACIARQNNLITK